MRSRRTQGDFESKRNCVRRMKPVYQRHLTWGAGDCAWACLASIFEEPLDSFCYDRLEALDAGDLAKLTECRWPHLRFYEEDCCYDFELVDADPAWGGDPQRWTYKVPKTFEPPTDGYWMASVASPRLKRPTEDPYYPMPALHAVVFKGDQLVHDPNPNYNVEYDRIHMKSWWEERKARDSNPSTHSHALRS